VISFKHAIYFVESDGCAILAFVVLPTHGDAKKGKLN
jgi:hypothetical protein